MLNDTYIKTMNRQIDRLSVYDLVFDQYTLTCHKLEIGNCLASDTFEQLHDYFSRNMLRFNKFVQDCHAITPPDELAGFHASFLAALALHQQAAMTMLIAIEPVGVNYRLYNRGVAEKKRATKEIQVAIARIFAVAM
ncbi:hypothetical protein [Lacticaseibacillus sp. N501-2]|uniref:hypothetical protein n=1 Tax=Lacticaseibacillus salsurae TaxID=3367729 RepID=UPI0038B3731B